VPPDNRPSAMAILHPPDCLLQRPPRSRRSSFRRRSGLLLAAPEGAARSQVFADGSWGGTLRDEFTPRPGEVTRRSTGAPSVCQHRSRSAAEKARHPPTDRDRLACEHLHRLDVRYAAELGYEVTLVKDAIGSYSWDEMKATLELNAPNYARAILSTKELIVSIDT
jgi:ureidoacrylate peracid hydrolase